MANYVIDPDDELSKALHALRGEWATVHRALHYALTEGDPDGVRNLLVNGARCEAAVERAKTGHARPACEPTEGDGRVMTWLKGQARRDLDRREARAAELDAAADVLSPPHPF